MHACSLRYMSDYGQGGIIKFSCLNKINTMLEKPETYSLLRVDFLYLHTIARNAATQACTVTKIFYRNLYNIKVMYSYWKTLSKMWHIRICSVMRHRITWCSISRCGIMRAKCNNDYCVHIELEIKKTYIGYFPRI
jgi:hypothetical protein